MWKETLIFVAIYTYAVGIHALAHRWAGWRARLEARRRAREDTSLDAISPLSRDVPTHHTAGKTHAVALIVAACAHPATLESVKHYAVHFLVYSGYVIPPH